MFGMLLWLGAAFILGTVTSHLVGLGHKGSTWHVGIGLAGLVLNWLAMMLLPLPHFVRVTVNGASVYLVWGPVFTLIVAAVVALFQPDPPELDQDPMA